MTDYPDPGEVPVLDWVDKGLIDIDPVYQRDLDQARVQKIAANFDWDSFGALVLSQKENGRFNCIDGQHRHAAALLHPLVSNVPAIISTKNGVKTEAETFVNVNGVRKNVSALEMFWAELAAEDPEAETVRNVCDRSGVKLLRYPGGSNGAYGPRETVAISALRSLVDKRGAFKARRILDIVAKADLAPITGLQIKAAELLMTDPEYVDAVEPDALTETIRAFTGTLQHEADAFAQTHRTSKTKALANVWFRKTRKKRKAA